MEKINFENYPSTDYPINADNLNKLQNNMEDAINENNTKLETLITFTKITGLSLDAGDTYQLSLPSNTLFIEPLVASSGAQESGGQFVVPGEGYSRIVNQDNTSDYNGIWVRCEESGLVTISTYRHSGNNITGFRIWYINI